MAQVACVGPLLLVESRRINTARTRLGTTGVIRVRGLPLSAGHSVDENRQAGSQKSLALRLTFPAKYHRVMSYREYQLEQRDKKIAFIVMVVYAVGCYFLVPPGWNTAAGAAVLLVGFTAPVVVPGSKAPALVRILLLFILFGLIYYTHKHQTTPTFNLFDPSRNRDVMLYAKECFGGLALGIGLFAIAGIILAQKQKTAELLQPRKGITHAEQVKKLRDRRINNPWTWFFGYFLIFFLILPLGLHFGYLYAFPFAICAYKCRGFYRGLSLFAVPVTIFITYMILMTQDKVLIGKMMSFGWIGTMFAAIFIYVLYDTFASETAKWLKKSERH